MAEKEERTVLLDHLEMGRENNSDVFIKGRAFRILAVASGLFFVFAFANSTFRREVPSDATRSSLSVVTSSPELLSFSVRSKDYGATLPGEGLYPFSLIAEIYKPSTLEVNFAGESGEEEEGRLVYFRWHVINDETHLEGKSVDHTFTKIGSNEVHLARYTAASDKKSDSIQSHKIIATVHVRYVKRELRSMSDSDREAFLDALEIVSSHFSMM